MGLEVLLYVPNIIGYVRVILAACAFAVYDHPTLFVLLYTISISLDGIDGYFARRLQQCSAFGSWLIKLCLPFVMAMAYREIVLSTTVSFDVLIDLFTRGYLWCTLFQSGYLVAFVEWMTFMSTHSRGEHWKIPLDQFPCLIKKVMAQELKTPLGVYTVVSLHLLPLWLYILKSQLLTYTVLLPVSVQLSVLSVLLSGRLLCAFVEFFYIKEHVLYLLHVNDQK